MYEIIKSFLDYLNTTDVSSDSEWECFSFPAPAKAFLKRVYENDIWDGEFREKINGIRSRKISDLNIAEIKTYFTAIICTERVCGGFFKEHAENGILKALLERYIQLCDDEEGIK